MALKPPIPPPAKPVRCIFMFKPNYQCPEMAEWCSPGLTEDLKFNWLCYCDIHKRDFLATYPKIPDTWLKL